MYPSTTQRHLFPVQMKASFLHGHKSSLQGLFMLRAFWEATAHWQALPVQLNPGSLQGQSAVSHTIPTTLSCCLKLFCLN